MISSNRRTKLIISRLLTAVFLFVILCTPISALAAGESVSDNGSDEEYESWDDALADSDYVDNLAEMVADYWVTTWLNYVGTGADVVEDVADLLGNQYDATKDLYENLIPYILPIATTTISNIPQNSITENLYGKPIRNKNNLKLIQDICKEVNDDVDSDLSDLPGKMKDNAEKSVGTLHFDFFSYDMYIKTSSMSLDWNPGYTYNSGYSSIKYNCPYNFSDSRLYNPLNGIANVNNDSVCFIFRFNNSSSGMEGYIYTINKDKTTNDNSYINKYYSYDISFNSWGYADCYTNRFYAAYRGWWNTTFDHYINFYGDCYFLESNEGKAYFWDSSEKVMYDLGYISSGDLNNPVGFIQNNNYNYNNEVDYTLNETINVIYTVDFDDYTDLINQLIYDVNMGNNVTNSLLIELIQEIRNQGNNYVQEDDDDIYDYIDYLTQKLTNVKDVHIEIPDITPDLGGIATALSALLNFLASIIRAIGDIVSSLLDGLFHLFVPTTDQWDELTVDFDTVMNPFRWIRGFLGEGVNAVSTCLFGSNVTDINSVSDELETVNASVAATRGEPSEHSSSHANIVYDEETGAPKIPVHFSNSTSEYFSDIGDAYIIDMNWYAPFKPVGDVIVVAFCWIMFIWRVIRDLPGIINGTSGITDNNPDTYSGEVNKQSTWHRISGR